MIFMQDVCKKYVQGAKTIDALRNFSLHISRGEFVAVMGPSGSGKSTLLNLLGGLDLPTSGRININDVELRGLDDNALTLIRRTHIGFVFQSFHLLPALSALDNVSLPLLLSGVEPSVATSKARAMLDQVGLGNRLGHAPKHLSGGEMQRVAIARALVHTPSLLLADEPTGNLDSTTSAEILALLRTIHLQGQTIVMVTHDPLAAKYSQRILTLKDGELESDSPLPDGAL